jgi:hypothetical protein
MGDARRALLASVMMTALWTPGGGNFHGEVAVENAKKPWWLNSCLTMEHLGEQHLFFFRRFCEKPQRCEL